MMQTRFRPDSCLDQVESILQGRAEAGEIDGFYRFIALHPEILEYIDQKPFSHTPLHAAAKAGQNLFVMEMMTRKPSLARKLDPNGDSPLHLSLQQALGSPKDEQKIHFRTLCQLVEADGELVRVKGKCGYTPFLYAVEHNGDLDLLLKFLATRPECLHDVNTRGETALHIVVRNNNLVVFVSKTKELRTDIKVQDLYERN